MEKEKAVKASLILNELDKMDSISSLMDYADNMWWSFCTPNCGKDEFIMPRILREEFKNAVARATERLKKELAEL